MKKMFKIHFLLLTAMSISVISVFFCINKERKVQETIKDPLKENQEPFKENQEPFKKIRNHLKKSQNLLIKDCKNHLKKIKKTIKKKFPKTF